MKYFISAGDPSGDMYAANLVRAIRRMDSGAEIWGLGGKRMAEAGVSLVENIADFSEMGTLEVLPTLWRLGRAFLRSRERIQRLRPDRIVLVDFPGFHFFLAEAVHGTAPLFWYIPPKVWAWGPNRLEKIKRLVRKVLCIFDFEPPIYQKAGIPCEWVGHPVLDTVAESGSWRESISAGAEVCLMPGSRPGVVRRHWPWMQKVWARLRRDFPDLAGRLVVPEHADPTAWFGGPAAWDGAISAIGQSDLGRRAECRIAIAVSGTSALENAVIGLPTITVYRPGWLTYAIGRRILRVSHISPVNLVAGEEVSPEFIGRFASVERVARQARDWLSDGTGPTAGRRVAEVRRRLGLVRQRLGSPGAAFRAAEQVIQG